jgi:hypothetical protein
MCFSRFMGSKTARSLKPVRFKGVSPRTVM